MKKKIAKQIESIAGKLPLIMRHTSERHFVKGAELIADDLTEVEGKRIDPEAMYINRLPVQIAINHKRAMKKMFKRYKGEGVQGYINAVNNYQAKKAAN